MEWFYSPSCGQHAATLIGLLERSPEGARFPPSDEVPGGRAKSVNAKASIHVMLKEPLRLRVNAGIDYAATQRIEGAQSRETWLVVVPSHAHSADVAFSGQLPLPRLQPRSHRELGGITGQCSAAARLILRITTEYETVCGSTRGAASAHSLSGFIRFIRGRFDFIAVANDRRFRKAAVRTVANQPTRRQDPTSRWLRRTRRAARAPIESRRARPVRK